MAPDGWSPLTESTGRGEAALVEGDVEFDGRDATLLGTIDDCGSIAAAASTLERSRARALRRIDTLEDAFGPLVERTRGGSHGGGSRLTANGREVLTRFERLNAVLSATATVPETVLEGTVTDVDGELATVETAVGSLTGIHDGTLADGDAVQLRVGADAVTVVDSGSGPEPDSTSARNRLQGTIADVESGETVWTVSVEVDGSRFSALVTDESASRLDLCAGSSVGLQWKATATRLVPTA